MEDIKELTIKLLESIRSEYSKKYANPVERLESNSTKALKYSEFLYKIKQKYNNEKIVLDKKYSELFKKFKHDNKFLLKNKTEIDSYIETDEEYNKLKYSVKELENLVELLSNVVDIYKQREASERFIFKFNTGE